MPQILGPEEVAKWALQGVGFDSGDHVEPHASMDEAVASQDGMLLTAGSACCLLIPVYVPEHKLGLLIHLDWQDALNEGEDLIRATFATYPELRERPVVRVIFSHALHAHFPGQIDEAKQFLRELLPDADLDDIIVCSDGDREEDDLMGVTARLDTRTGTLHIEDDFGPEQTHALSVRSS